jgi:hypothetical protein
MADPLPWPSVLMPSSEDWSLRGGTRSGGQTFQGNEQIVVSPTARWKATLNIPCWEPEHVLAMRRVIALGRSQLWFVGPFEEPRAPWNIDLVGGKITYLQAAQNPAVYFGDQSATLDFRISGDTGAGSTTIAIMRNRGGVLGLGMLFGIGGRMHTIVGLSGEIGTPGTQGTPGIVEAAIRPWLRAGSGNGTPIEFGAPGTIMRLASDDTGALELQLSRYGTVTIELVEAL